MRIAHQYKLKPNKEQKARLNRWLNMLRHQYNYLLAERFDWWSSNRCLVNACPLVCQLPDLKEQPDYYSQKCSLVSLKKERPWYGEIHSQVLQDMVKRVKITFDRYLGRNTDGKRSGKPRYKPKNRYKTLTYPQAKLDWLISSNKIKLPKIGEVRFILHRPLPSGFNLKTVSITKKADGFYITFSLEDKSVPEVISDVVPTEENSTAIDLGCEYFATLADGTTIETPKYFRRSQDKLVKLQQKASARKKGSRARKLLYKKVAKLHQKIARQRKQFHFELSSLLLAKYDAVFVEDLTVKNMVRRNKPKQDGAYKLGGKPAQTAPHENGNYLPNNQSAKSGLNKSILDCGWSQFLDILSLKAERAGLKVIKINPRGTSQVCVNCLNRVDKQLSDRWHCCYHCGVMMPRDWNSALLLKKLGLDETLSLKRSTARKRSQHHIA
ncbi:MAG: RNA-guided endonuclease InsQ/TnpB family protein [Xenococcaceae cyanobacterium]